MVNSILIVENDVRLKIELTSALSKAGFMVAEAPDYTATLLKEFKPDMVIMDMVLQSMNGMKACNQIRSMFDIPVVLLGEDFSDEAWERIMQADADLYEVKPLNYTTLVARVKAIFRRYEVWREPKLQSRLKLFRNRRKES